MALPSVCLYFHVHQPMRLKRFSIFDSHPKKFEERYFDGVANEHYFEKAANQCYIPATDILLKKIEEEENFGRAFKASFSISGVFLDQCKKFKAGKKVLENFSQLAKTNKIEFIAETYYHSLASLYSHPGEFFEQVNSHCAAIRDNFGKNPRSFRNTELLYSNETAKLAQGMGFQAILAEGVERVLGWRSPNYVYSPKIKNPKIKLMLRNFKLSDDVGYRFSSKWWSEYPLTAEKYSHWLSKAQGDTINLFMDFETFGEHHWKDTGILDFLQALPTKLADEGFKFKTVTETAKTCETKDELDCKHTISWADLERDESAWLGNDMQKSIFHELQRLKYNSRRFLSKENAGEIMHAYRLLQTSDHLYYMCTKNWDDGDVHKYFAHHKNFSPYDSFINYMNILQDFKAQLKDEQTVKYDSKISMLKEMAEKLRSNGV